MQNVMQIVVRSPQASVGLHEIAPGAVIHYTLDGSMPTSASRVYGGPLTVDLKPNQTTTVSAIAVLQNGRTSAPSFLRLTEGVVERPM
jgi:hypothetical protein